MATLNRDGYHRLNQNWKQNDAISIKYLMKTRGVIETNQGRTALFHGPWLLGANELSDPFFFDEPHQLNVLGVRVQKNGTVDLKREATARCTTGIE